MARANDPVCHMAIDSATATETATHNGRTYYFCSTACQRHFLADPARYVAGAEAPADVGAGEADPPYTKRGDIVAPKFGAAGSGGLEYEPLPEPKDKS